MRLRQHFRIHGRTSRALIAVLAAMALAVVLLFQQRQIDEERQRAIFTVSANAWKISELVFETERLASGLLEYRAGLLGKDAVNLRFDLLWSRVGTAGTTNIRDSPDLAGILMRYQAFLTREEPVIYTAPDVPHDEIARLRRVLGQLAQDTRAARIKAFTELQVKEITDNIAGPMGGKVSHQAVVMVLTGILMAYMLAEIYFASQAQERETVLRKKAAEASAAKSQFLANVSHEIRTPLNGILGMASELGETALDSDQRLCLQIIRESGAVLLATIGDVLDLSKIEAGKLTLQSQPFALRSAIERSLLLNSAAGREKGLQLSATVEEGLPDNILGDVQRFRQVLHNLISNAVKFTGTGGVEITAQSADAGRQLRIRVSDTGPGVPPEARERIFEPFGQADSSATRKQGGTGLGLSISQQLSKAMGGCLLLISGADEGAVFEFRLPLVPAGAADDENLRHMPAGPEPPVLSPCRVLVVDDSKTNRLILSRFLAHTACRIQVASCGREAVEYVRSGAYDVVLMDIQMPQMDGMEATQYIRSIEKEEGRPPSLIVAVTANVMPTDIESFRAAGMDDVLSKPVSKKDLLAAMSRRNRMVA
mgnify:CR=1 FL=1